MKTAWQWIKKYWYLPVFVVVSIILWALFRRSGPPFEQTIAEVKAIKAEAETQRYREIMGTTKAKELVEERYQKEIEVLNDKQAKQAKKLEHDPAMLAKFLVRASRGKSNR